MSNLKSITELIRGIAGQANVLTIPRVFVKLTGNIKAALFLSQCIYWSDKTKRADGYFYKTAEEWEEDTGLTRNELETCRRKCAEFVDTKIIKANGAPTLHYRVDLEKLIYWIMENGIVEKREMELAKSDNSDLPKSDNSLTEITQNPQQNPQQQEEDAPAAAPPMLAASAVAFRAFQKVTGMMSYPGKDRDKIEDALNGLILKYPTVDALVEYLTPFFAAWVERGYQKSNCAWLYDWAVAGEIPPVKGNGKAKAATPPMDDFVEKARRMYAEQQEARYG